MKSWLRDAEERGLIGKETKVNLETLVANSIGRVMLDSGSMNALDEKTYMRMIVSYAQDNGYDVYHTLDSRGSDEGFPDLVIAKGHICFVVEVKTTKGVLTDSQKKWGAIFSALQAASQSAIQYRVWRPADWPDAQKALKEGS